MIYLIPYTIKNILLKLEKNGFDAYIVGGAVRDFLMGKKTNDFDIATNALPKDIIKILGPSKEKNVYGSFHRNIENLSIDITTYRKEFTYKNRKEFEFEYTNDLISDAKRRDFTINALYQNKDGDIIDPLNVLEDIKKKNLKMIGNPTQRVKEDPLRILRAIRFASMYHLKIDKSLEKAIKEEKINIKKLSKERIKKELDSILLANGFPLLKKLNLLETLGIESKKIVYVNDLGGLWAQIKEKENYPKEKNLKKHEKTIKEILKYDTMNMILLYRYGYYDCKVACQIKSIPIKRLEKMQQKLPIKNRKEIVYSGKEIERLFHIHKEELGIILKEIEEKIILGKIKNTKESIENYIKER